jgi:ABC-type sugar transport system ATPase subunit
VRDLEVDAREQARGEGKSILLISSDMPEAIRLSNRILMMRDHAIVGELPKSHQYD